MALPKSKYRELVFQILFRHHFLDQTEKDEVRFFMHALKTTKQQVQHAQSHVQAICEKIPEIDVLIKEVSVGYELDRIQAVELNVMRLIAYELFYLESISIEVAVAEATRLVNKFSAKEAAPFVHALVDRLYKNKVHAL